jgi:tetratricopeptide (TPR) repeat protein
VATNKRKILENARKLAQKGAKDKALKEYERLVKLDPRDAKLRLEIGDAHRRWGQVDEAASTYTKVAEQYMKDGFDARAVAVYKQILNLDPDRLDSYEPLAELYERMGLTGEAIAALQTAADGHHRAGDKRAALELLRKMSTIDPTNTTSRIKVAELLRQEEMISEAVVEYEQVAAELDRQGDVEASGNVHRRVLEMDPKRVGSLVALAKSLLAQGRAEEAEPVAKQAVVVEDQEPDHYELLAEVYRTQNREDLLPDVYRSLAEIHRRRGDDDKARDLLQRYVPGELSIDELGESDAGLGDDDFLAPPLDAVPPEDELSLSGDSFSAAGAGESLAKSSLGGAAFSDDALDELEDELDLGPELEVGPDPEALELSQELDSDEAAAEATVSGMQPGTQVQPPLDAPSGDPDQLLAEASVYLRYGKRDKAIAHLEAILRQEPSHRLALEKLGEAFAEGEDDARAVELWLQAAKCAEEEGDADGVAVLRGRIEALDPSAASGLGAAPEAPPAPTDDDLLDASDDDLLDDELEAPGEEPEPPAAEDDLELEFDLDIDEPEEVSSETLDDESASELDLSLDDDAEEEDAEEQQIASPPASEASLSSTSAQQILEDLEEADFYMEQGLHDEAEEIYKRVLSVAPNHPRALVRLGEVAAGRGEDPGATGSAITMPPEADAAPEAAEAKSAAPEAGIAADAGPSPELSADDIDIDDDAELSFDEADLDVPEDELEVSAPELEPDPAKVAAEERVSEDDGPTGVSAEPETDEDTTEFKAVKEVAPRTPAVVPSVDADFDLAAELSDVFDEDPNEVSGSVEASDDGFSAVFDAFKKGVSETLTAGDHEAHFDLGIAYKEMGLLDDAIQEFRASMVHPPRVIECLHLIGLCALDGGQPDLAAAERCRPLRAGSCLRGARAHERRAGGLSRRARSRSEVPGRGGALCRPRRVGARGPGRGGGLRVVRGRDRRRGRRGRGARRGRRDVRRPRGRGECRARARARAGTRTRARARAPAGTRTRTETCRAQGTEGQARRQEEEEEGFLLEDDPWSTCITSVSAKIPSGTTTGSASCHSSRPRRTPLRGWTAACARAGASSR